MFALSTLYEASQDLTPDEGRGDLSDPAETKVQAREDKEAAMDKDEGAGHINVSLGAGQGRIRTTLERVSAPRLTISRDALVQVVYDIFR